jgi:pyruvate/2-oxoglutarate dehydrogenase complex dihydrolipoamide dehydrogenase (E3) component
VLRPSSSTPIRMLFPSIRVLLPEQRKAPVSDMEQLDAIIIGTGQAGKPLAGALAEAGWKTAIVERDRVGGTCVVRGCTPTKTMVASARVAWLAGRGDAYGVRCEPVAVDMEAVRDRKRQIVDEWSSGSEKGMRRHETLELVLGEARFTGMREVEVTPEESDVPARRFTAKHVFIHTGARPRTPGIPGLDEVPALDSTSVMELGEVPEHLVIVGGGFVGLEFAQMFRRFGADVTILERGERIAAHEDPDISEALTDIFREDGIEVITGCEVLRAGCGPDGVIHLDLRCGEDRQTLEGSHLLAATGRTPNTDALDLEKAGVELDERGYVVVNERLETTASGVWALGDVAGSDPFTHVAYDDFRVVKANLLEGGDRSREERGPVYTLFTDPQLGRVGLSESEARERGLSIRVATLPMSKVARAIEVDETRGLMKVVVDAETDRILGAAILGIEGGELAAMLQIAMLGDLPYTTLRDGVFSHPTLSESFNNLFGAFAD